MAARAFRPVCADDYSGHRFDPQTYNCWHFVAQVWRDLTGEALPDLTPERGELLAAADSAAASGRFTQHPGSTRAMPPEIPAIVLFRRHPDPPHVGVWWRGKVLHLLPSGVAFQSLGAVCPGSEATFWVPAV